MQQILAPTQNAKYTADANPFILSEFLYIDAFTGKDTKDSMSSRTRSVAETYRVGSSVEVSTTDDRNNQLVAIYIKRDSFGKIVNTKRINFASMADAPVQLDASEAESYDKTSAWMAEYDALPTANSSAAIQAEIDKRTVTHSTASLQAELNKRTVHSVASIQAELDKRAAASAAATQARAAKKAATAAASGSITGNNNVIFGVTSFPSFFDQLNNYLIGRFSDAFKSNAEREIQNGGTDLGVEVDASPGEDSYIDPSSVLGASGGSLFDRASQGDTKALQVIQDQINWDWSASEQAVKDLQQTSKDASKKLKELEDQFKEWGNSLDGMDILKTVTGVQSVTTSGGGKPFSAPPLQLSSVVPQPQPFTPPPLKMDTTPTNPQSDVLPTNPFPSTTHFSVGKVPQFSPPSPPAPKQK